MSEVRVGGSNCFVIILNMNDDAQDSQQAAALPPFWKRMVINLFWLGLVAMLVQVVLIAFASRWWLADLFTHFRMQALLLGLLLLVTSVTLRYRYAWIAPVLLIAPHVWVLAPYLPTRNAPPISDNAETLLSWNVFAGNKRHDEIVLAIRELDADVVLLMEVSPELGVQLGGLRDLYPEIRISPSTDAFGIALLSRQPLPELTIERIGEELFNTVVAKFDNGVTFLGVHTLPPAGSHYSRIRNQQLRELAESVSELDGPVIIAGDLNVSPFSPHFQKLLKDAALTDTRRGRGVLNSWPDGRLLTHIPIDHVLVTKEIEVGELKILSDSHGSDHFPVFCRWNVKE